MNKQSIVILGVIILGIIGFGMYRSSSTGMKQDGTEMAAEQEPSGMMEKTETSGSGGMMEESGTSKSMGDAMSADMMAMLDGKTIMVMGGKMNPETLNVAPGTKIRVLNHEAVAMSIMSTDDTSFKTTEIKPDGEDYFTAPSKVGSYMYESSVNPALKGTLVVEQ